MFSIVWIQKIEQKVEVLTNWTPVVHLLPLINQLVVTYSLVEILSICSDSKVINPLVVLIVAREVSREIDSGSCSYPQVLGRHLSTLSCKSVVVVSEDTVKD